MLAEVRFTWVLKRLLPRMRWLVSAPRGKLLDVDVVVFAFGSVEEPGAVADERPGEGEAGNELVEAHAVDLAKGRDEVGGVEAELVVAHAGVERYDAAGARGRIRPGSG